MKIKTATLLGMIGAIISLCQYLFYLLLNSKAISLVNEDWDYEKKEQVYLAFNVTNNILSAFSSLTLMMFFYVLYKNQKQ